MSDIINNLIIGLTGQLDLTGVKINTLTTNLANNSTNLSGNLALTGSNLYNSCQNNATNLSGNLALTGSNLFNQCTNNSNNLSGNLASTGTNLINLLGAFSRGTCFYNPDGIPTGSYYLPIWRSQYACTLTGIHGLRISGAGATINIRKNFNSGHLISDLSITSTGAWQSSGIIRNPSYVIGDTLEAQVTSVTSFPVSVSIQADFTKP